MYFYKKETKEIFVDFKAGTLVKWRLLRRSQKVNYLILREISLSENENLTRCEFI